MTHECRSVRARSFIGLVAGLFVAAASIPAAASQPITVKLDRAKIIRLPARAATVVIGDPLIADLSLQPGGLAVITGKGFGATNVIVLDHEGAVLTEQTIEVQGPTDPTVVVYRGVARETYSCSPECLPRITLGDDSKYFSTTIDQSGTRNNQAIAAGSKSDSGAPIKATDGTVNAPGVAPPPPSPQNPADRH